jgi:hypothetical protein
MKFIKLTSRNTNQPTLVNISSIQLVRTIYLSSSNKLDGSRIFFISNIETDDYTEVIESVQEIQSAINKALRGC